MKLDRRTFLTAGASTLVLPMAFAADGTPGPWKDGKRWVYSITYDEGANDLLTYALPLHRNYGIPGHIALVATQIGVPRNVPCSSYHGMMIVSTDEIHGLIKEGWGMSCHSMTHASIVDDNAHYEVVESRKVLEDALGVPISIFTVPGSNECYPASLKVIGEAGYKAILTITDRVNKPDDDLMNLGRVPLHTQYPAPFFSEYDPYKRIHQAIDLGGWIVDYCHCPMPDKPIHPAKDCTTQELEHRFETIKRIGGDEVWLAEPNEVVAWMLEQRS